MAKLILKKEDIDRCWLTSDLHLGHKNIVGPKISNWKTGYRTFDSIDQMDSTIIDNINKLVGQDDLLFHLGDFSYVAKKQPWAYRNRIVCKNIYHVYGNHDKIHTLANINNFHCCDYLEVVIDDIFLCMFHYKQAVWNKSHRGAYHFYGHSHSTAEHMQIGRSIDVGIDNAYRLLGSYEPFKLTWLLDYLDKIPIKSIDHHDHNTND